MSFPTPSPSQPRTRRMSLERLNTAAEATVEPLLLRCCGSRRWARRIVAHRPYPDVAALLAAADEASYDLTSADLREALVDESAAHPLEGEPQLGILAAHTALRAAHGAYERKFGHAFLCCLDGFAVEERLDQALAGIRLRLENDAEDELCVTAEELRRLAQGRLGRLVGSDSPE
ncbi:2-oxo-4-hydroxy-4-carboxy-5-ureidoimidazoline decarboxylase [Streptomyces sp. DW4-2]|uniref:2-oxo-4-hydroxy-4-carboxy-5-ureidoimidazoline decarboxylase n=2 Tax=Streptomyces spirodelae TaxID=2812904 RepID=A0ABS3WUJ1_9ACTN|nr:2-oxo-4-hydroxy-4-carboxy-5-ureidoimidazoline decarboxylase [Streptomyces spirodelae]